MKKKRHGKLRKIFFIALTVFFVFLGVIIIWAATVKLPDLSTFQARKIANSSKIVDRTGEVVLYDIHKSVRRTEIPLDQISNNIKEATIAIEDYNFYNHRGIRVKSIARATYKNITSGSFSQGGSTITQQIIKNTLLTPEKSPTRKVKEWALALKLERTFPKDRILEIYLNDNPYGGTVYGVEEASRIFFNKEAAEVTLAEAAYLAAIPQAPTYYSPFGKNRQKLEERKNVVLRRMHDLEFITTEEYEAAKAETVIFDSAASNGIKAPHFVFYIQELLEETYGTEAMITGGYTIVTTLDYDLQKKAEELALQYATQNEKKYNASNTALVALDPNTGQILSMVGSRNYFDKEIDGAYNVATGKPGRQPGSSFKPFVYAAAFNKGYTPETVLFDVKTQFSTSCNALGQPLAGRTSKDCYSPGNFDDKFRGPMSLRNALAQSINVPSVKLLYLVGLPDALETAQRMGITTLKKEKDYGLSLVLGGGEVSLLDMTTAYGVFAAGGVKHEPVGILQVRNHVGEIIEENVPSNGEEVLPKNSALIISDILSDNVARTPTFGSASALYIKDTAVAAKTGTTNDNKDAWVMGYTPNLVVGVWSGNNDNKTMRNGGVAVSGPLWNAFMQYAIPRFPAVAFEKPAIDPDYENLKPILRGKWLSTETIEVDITTGQPATDTTPPEYKTQQTIPITRSILYWVNKADPLGPRPSNPSSDPQFHLWDPPVLNWWYTNQGRYTSQPASTSPQPTNP